jgi:hypothetical protein
MTQLLFNKLIFTNIVNKSSTLTTLKSSKNMFVEEKQSKKLNEHSKSGNSFDHLIAKNIK